MLRRGTPNISYHLIDDICGFLVNKWTKPLLGDLNLAKIVSLKLTSKNLITPLTKLGELG